MIQLFQRMWGRYHDVKTPLFALSLVYIFAVFVGSAVVLYLDTTFSLNDVVRQYALTWTLALGAGVGLAALVTNGLQCRARAIWRVVIFDAFYILFGSVVTRLLVQGTGLVGIYLPLLLGFVLSQAVMVISARRGFAHWPVILAGLALLTSGLTLGTIYTQPVILQTVEDDYTVTLSAPHR